LWLLQAAVVICVLVLSLVETPAWLAIVAVAGGTVVVVELVISLVMASVWETILAAAGSVVSIMMVLS
jgi:hypothetical protein